MAGIKGVIIRKFRVRQTIKGTQAALASGYRKAARFVEREIKDLISTPYPPASKRGQPPHMRTGNLRKSVKVTGTKNGMTVRTLKYGEYLERPRLNRMFTVPIFRQNRSRIAKIIRNEVKRLANQKAKRRRRR